MIATTVREPLVTKIPGSKPGATQAPGSTPVAPGNNPPDEPPVEAKALPLEAGLRFSSVETVDVYTVYLLTGIGTSATKKELTSHTSEVEALIAAWIADPKPDSKEVSIEIRHVWKIDDGRYINGDRIPLQMGIDKGRIAKLRQERLDRATKVDQILFLQYNEKGEHIATSSES